MKRLRRLNGQQITNKIFPKEDGEIRKWKCPLSLQYNFKLI